MRSLSLSLVHGSFLKNQNYGTYERIKEKFYVLGIEENSTAGESALDPARHILFTSLAFLTKIHNLCNMVRKNTKTYFFVKRDNAFGYEYRDSTKSVFLVDYVGETLATALCDCDNGLEMLRFSRPAEQIIVHKTMLHIKLEISKWFNV